MRYNRILIIRTDRIGDVLLSTPVIQALREAYPKTYIAIMVRPYTKDVVWGNPYLDKVIIYDKDDLHRSIFATILFALRLRRERFDLALILHSTNRSNWIAYLAGIPQRIGYDKRCGFLLTERIPYIKKEGIKHEMEYTLDMLRALDIPVKEPKPYIPVREDAKERIAALFEKLNIEETDFLVGIHPAASCPSKRWPYERFAQLADRLIEEKGAKPVIVGSDYDSEAVNIIKKMMRHNPIICLGLSVAELAALLLRCKFFISNDTGPAHIAAALDTPVLVIFGRAQPGLSPTRWQPIGKQVAVFHRDVGCKVCLAHNCKKGFGCLRAISVDEVLDAARKYY